jgi:type II secretory pathway pseudopilin PulG
LLELLVVIGVIAILLALTGVALGRSQERARRAQCDGMLRQFYLAVKMYADDNEGYVSHYTNFLSKMEMICPSDKQRRTWMNSSYDSSPFIFGSRQRLDDAPPESWLLVECAPFHDLSKKRSPEPGKWIGRFNLLNADGTLVWQTLHQ